MMTKDVDEDIIDDDDMAFEEQMPLSASVIDNPTKEILGEVSTDLSKSEDYIKKK